MLHCYNKIVFIDFCASVLFEIKIVLTDKSECSSHLSCSLWLHKTNVEKFCRMDGLVMFKLYMTQANPYIQQKQKQN